MDQISEKQIKWLYSRGGRTIYDLCVDTNGRYFVYMSNAKGKGVKIFIPSDKDIDTYYREVNSILFQHQKNEEEE